MRSKFGIYGGEAGGWKEAGERLRRRIKDHFLPSQPIMA
jgi:hypothetical protein